MSDTGQVTNGASSLAAARAELAGCDARRVMIAAWDIGKDVHMLYVRTLAGEVLLAPTKVASLATGYAWARQQLDEGLHSGRYDLVLLGHEPTGVYHESLSQNLALDYASHCTGEAKPLVRHRWLNPALVKQERQRASQRYRKSDTIDVVAISNLLADGQGYPAPILTTAESELRLTLRYMQHLMRRQRRLGIGLLRTLDRLWPGALGNSQAYQRSHPELPALLHLVDSKPLERQRLRVLLEQCIDPHRLCGLGAAGIRQLFEQQGRRCGQATAERIYAVAQQALLPPPPVCALLAEQVQADFAQYRLLEGQLAEGEARVAALLPATCGQVLTSLEGVSPALATRYLAGLGDPDRFQSARQVWAYAGYDPAQSDSGNRRRNGSISHRGSPYLRATLYQIGYLTALHCADCTRLYVQARQRGLSKTLAVIHVANKANRILFALLKSQEPYRSPVSAEEAEHWRQLLAKQR
jgi:hypothetical protein